MDNGTIQTLSFAIDPATFDSLVMIANKLGIAIKDIFPYFVKQQCIISIAYWFQTISLWIMIFVFGSWTLKVGKNDVNWSNTNYMGINGFKFVCFMVITILSLMFGTIQLFGYFEEGLRMLNPEHGAIEEMIGLIK